MDNFLLQSLLENTGAQLAFITPQGVAQKYGHNRENKSERIIDAMRTYLGSHRPLYADLRGTFIAV